jgi:hypothetical protein
MRRELSGAPLVTHVEERPSVTAHGADRLTIDDPMAVITSHRLP